MDSRRSWTQSRNEDPMLRLLRNREFLNGVLDVAKAAIEGARNLAELRSALSKAILRGDLDEALAKFVAANGRAKDYIETGR